LDQYLVYRRETHKIDLPWDIFNIISHAEKSFAGTVLMQSLRIFFLTSQTWHHGKVLMIAWRVFVKVRVWSNICIPASLSPICLFYEEKIRKT